MRNYSRVCSTFDIRLYLPVYGSSGAIKEHATCHMPWHANRCGKSALSPHERSEINCRAVAVVVGVVVVSYVPGIGNVLGAMGKR